MNVIEAQRSAAVPTRTGSVVEVVIPVYNEEATLEVSIRRLREFLDHSFPFRARITIADNASTDGTLGVANRLASELGDVGLVHLAEKGRGRALREVWLQSDADVVAYMDVDLSTGLEALLPLVAPLLSGHSDIAIGSRLAQGARVLRGAKRELISRTYNLIIHTALHNQFSDAQCGFKAMRRDVAQALLPLVSDNAWFFDTELLVLAERNGFRIHEVPVDWIDDPHSTVDIVRTARDDLLGIARLLRELRKGEGRIASPPRPEQPKPTQVVRFARVGLLSTLVYLALFLFLQGTLGGYWANLTSIVVCTLLNSVVHFRYTFGGQKIAWAEMVVVIGAPFLAYVALTTGALLAASAVFPRSTFAQVMGLGAATGAAAVIRFAVLRSWMFRRHLNSQALLSGRLSSSYRSEAR